MPNCMATYFSPDGSGVAAMARCVAEIRGEAEAISTVASQHAAALEAEAAAAARISGDGNVSAPTVRRWLRDHREAAQERALACTRTAADVQRRVVGPLRDVVADARTAEGLAKEAAAAWSRQQRGAQEVARRFGEATGEGSAALPGIVFPVVLGGDELGPAATVAAMRTLMQQLPPSQRVIPRPGSLNRLFAGEALAAWLKSRGFLSRRDIERYGQEVLDAGLAKPAALFAKRVFTVDGMYEWAVPVVEAVEGEGAGDKVKAYHAAVAVHMRNRQAADVAVAAGGREVEQLVAGALRAFAKAAAALNEAVGTELDIAAAALHEEYLATGSGVYLPQYLPVELPSTAVGCQHLPLRWDLFADVSLQPADDTNVPVVIAHVLALVADASAPDLIRFWSAPLQIGDAHQTAIEMVAAAQNVGGTNPAAVLAHALGVLRSKNSSQRVNFLRFWLLSVRDSVVPAGMFHAVWAADEAAGVLLRLPPRCSAALAALVAHWLSCTATLAQLDSECPVVLLVSRPAGVAVPTGFHPDPQQAAAVARALTLWLPGKLPSTLPAGPSRLRSPPPVMRTPASPLRANRLSVEEPLLRPFRVTESPHPLPGSSPKRPRSRAASDVKPTMNLLLKLAIEE